MPRISPLAESEWGEELRAILQATPPGFDVRLGDNALGIAREEILRIADGPDAAGWTAADATLLRAADELHARAKIADDTWALLADSYDERGLLEIAMLVGHYHMVAFALNSAGVELDAGLEGLP